MNNAPVMICPLSCVNLPNSRLSGSSSLAGMPSGYLDTNHRGYSLMLFLLKIAKGWLRLLSGADRSYKEFLLNYNRIKIQQK